MDTTMNAKTIIPVNYSDRIGYSVYVGENTIYDAPAILRERFPRAIRTVVVADANVTEYGNRLVGALREAGLETSLFTFEGGEHNKTLESIEKIVRYLAECGLDRDSFICGVGGGITGDVSAFAASIYMRGIGFASFPTTLLAAVDSSVGGKTGVNLGGLKNMVGTFSRPSAVFCDTTTFATLPAREFACGMAEVIKYAVSLDAELLCELESETPPSVDDIISRCVSIKAGVVMRDEHESGERMLLNFGHTIGHAIEKCSDAAFLHGEAVGLGMLSVTRGAEAKGICPEGLSTRILALLKKYDLPTECDLPRERLIAAASHDKKKSGKQTRFILPTDAGKSAVFIFSDEAVGDYVNL